MIAKEIVQRKPNKVIAMDWNISESLISSIRKEFVIETLTERYPDGWQADLFKEGL